MEIKQNKQLGGRNRHAKHLPSGNTYEERCCLPKFSLGQQNIWSFCRKENQQQFSSKYKDVFFLWKISWKENQKTGALVFTPPNWGHYVFHHYNLCLYLSQCLQPLVAAVICPLPLHNCLAMASYKTPVDIHLRHTDLIYIWQDHKLCTK